MPEISLTTDPRWKAVLPVLLAAPALFALSGKGGPLFSDEGSLLLIGHGIANGRLLYESYINEKPPALFLFSALFMRENPVNHLVWYRFGIAILAGGAAAWNVWRISRNGRLLRGFLTGTGILLAFGFHLGFQWSPNSLIALAALLLPVLLDEGRSSRSLAAAGFVAGFLLFSRLQNLPMVIAVLACVGRDRARQKGFFSGFVGFTAAMLSFLAATGTLPGFWHYAFAENTFSGGFRDYAFAFGAPADYLILAVGVAYAAATASRIGHRSGELNNTLVLLFGALLSGAPRFDHQRMLAAEVILVLAFAVLAPERPPFFKKTATLLLVTGTIFTGSRFLGTQGAYTNGLAAYRDVAVWLRTVTPAESRIAVMPHGPYLHLLAGMEPASPRYFLLPWRSTPQMQKEIITALEREEFPPITDLTLAGAAGAPLTLHDYAEDFVSFRKQNYRLERTFPSGIQVWLRRAPARESR